MGISETNPIIDDLFSMQDLKYKAFQSKLIPNIDQEKMIMVPIPKLRNYAKLMYASQNAQVFLHTLPHFYFDEYNLHVLLIEQMKDIDECLDAINTLLPYIDNWATCDLLNPKVLKNHKDLLLPAILKWLKSDHGYTIRFAINMLMKHYIKNDFNGNQLNIVANIKHDDYYVKMVIAFYLQQAYQYHKDDVLAYLNQNQLDQIIINKMISKVNDSKKINDEDKLLIKKYRR